MYKVLIVEDDINIARLHSKFTEKVEGFSVCGIANSLEDAVDMVELLEPDLILLDVFFPLGSGLEFLRQMRSEAYEIEVILITAAREAGTFKQAMQGGAFDYIVKPVIFERFKQSLLRFGDYQRELNGEPDFDQSHIDSLLGRQSKQEQVKLDLPKGIDPITLQKIEELFQDTESLMTADQVGKTIGASRNTARRYLEYLVSIRLLKVDIDYGSIGRPEKHFSKAWSP